MRASAAWASLLVLSCTGANPAFLPGQHDAGVDAAPADVSAADQLDVADAPVGEPVFDAPPIAPDMTVIEDAAIADAAPDAPPAFDSAPDTFVPPAGCGTATADLSGIAGADGLVIDDDGTLYFLTDDSINSYVGRVQPGLAPQIKWLRIDNSPTTWGLALDSPRQRLYVLVVDGPGALVAFDDIKGTPIGSQFIVGIANGNDVTVGPDGTIYYTGQTDREVFSSPPTTGKPTTLTTTPIGTAEQKPAAIAVAPDGGLLVGLEHGGPLYKLTLAGGRESSRALFGTWTGWANGLAFDRRGRVYIAMDDDSKPQAVVRLEADGKTVTTLLSGSRYSSIAFGRGVLDCRDLYVADPYGGPIHRVRVPDSL